MIDDNTVITLDDNQKYTIVSKVNYEGDTYFYLANIDTISDFLIGSIKADEITVVKDEPLLSNLILKFAEVMQEKN